MSNDIGTLQADVGHHGNIESSGRNQKTAGLHGIMQFQKWIDIDCANLHLSAGRKEIQEWVMDCLTVRRIGFLRDEDRNGKSSAKHIDAANMIGVFVRDKYPPHLGHGYTKVGHSSDDLFTADACIDQNGIMIIFQIITVAVASRSY